MLAAILAMASTVLVVATFNVSGTTSTAPNPVRASILRRQDKMKQTLTGAEIAYLRAHAQEDKKEERVFENKIPGHLPIKVKLRAEKEKAAKDLDNPRWHRDLELQVKNAGDKPIYYLSFIIEFPEIKLDGSPVSVHIRYGKHSLFDDSKGKAAPEDTPLKPKKTLILSLDEDSARAWEQWQQKEKWSQHKRVIIEFEQLSFGDGTGFWGNGAPWPFPKGSVSPSQAQYRTLGTQPDIKSHHASVWPIDAFDWR
ncbi:MAG TPA: hypothetical protein VJT71_13075 [Pyrinomonadaceae bacterium]|nr:hypothetical protein [Pyrinomonadaceae bacterium]